jgi:hypothetical protein
MKQFITTDYPNLLDSVNISSNDIQTQISSYRLTFLNTRNDTVEWGMQLPMFLPCFYDYLITHQSILNQIDFYNYYLEVNKKYFNSQSFSNTIYEGIKARAFRTYPSLVRDIHFATFIKERNTNWNIIYNTTLDIEEGIDLLIVYNNTFYGINLFTNTARAFQGRQKKEFRHTKFDNVKYIDIPVEFKGSLKCGDFFLYGAKEYNQINASI